MKKQLFLSDFHLGVPTRPASMEREAKICQLLTTLADELSDVYFVGDVFDFWFEYKTVVPKGYYLFFGTLIRLANQGVQLHFFRGNHDMWMHDLFQQEFNAKIYSNPIEIKLGGKQFYIGHGDGLGPGDYKYKFLKKFFASTLCQSLFRWIHPDIGIKLANFFSYRSRFGQPQTPEVYHGSENEWLYIFCQSKLKEKHIDYFIFGHRHLPIYTKIENSESLYINLGDWLNFDTYAIFDGNRISLQQLNSEKKDFLLSAHTDS